MFSIFINHVINVTISDNYLFTFKTVLSNQLFSLSNGLFLQDILYKIKQWYKINHCLKFGDFAAIRQQCNRYEKISLNFWLNWHNVVCECFPAWCLLKLVFCCFVPLFFWLSIQSQKRIEIMLKKTKNFVTLVCQSREYYTTVTVTFLCSYLIKNKMLIQQCKCKSMCCCSKPYKANDILIIKSTFLIAKHCDIYFFLTLHF